MSVRITMKNVDFFKFRRLILDGSRDDYDHCDQSMKGFCDDIEALRSRSHMFTGHADRACIDRVRTTYLLIRTMARIDSAEIKLHSGWWGRSTSVYSAGKLKPEGLRDSLTAMAGEYRNRKSDDTSRDVEEEEETDIPTVDDNIDEPGVFYFQNRDHPCYQFVGYAKEGVMTSCREIFRTAYEGNSPASVQDLEGCIELSLLLTVTKATDWQFYFVNVEKDENSEVCRSLVNDMLTKHDTLWPYGLNSSIKMETDFERVQFRRSAQRHSWPPKQDADYTIDPYSMTSYISRLRKEHDLHLVDKCNRNKSVQRAEFSTNVTPKRSAIVKTNPLTRKSNNLDKSTNHLLTPSKKTVNACRSTRTTAGATSLKPLPSNLMSRSMPTPRKFPAPVSTIGRATATARSLSTPFSTRPPTAKNSTTLAAKRRAPPAVQSLTTVSGTNVHSSKSYTKVSPSPQLALNQIPTDIGGDNLLKQEILKKDRAQEPTPPTVTSSSGRVPKQSPEKKNKAVRPTTLRHRTVPHSLDKVATSIPAATNRFDRGQRSRNKTVTSSSSTSPLSDTSGRSFLKSSSVKSVRVANGRSTRTVTPLTSGSSVGSSPEPIRKSTGPVRRTPPPTIVAPPATGAIEDDVPNINLGELKTMVSELDEVCSTGKNAYDDVLKDAEKVLERVNSDRRASLSSRGSPTGSPAGSPTSKVHLLTGESLRARHSSTSVSSSSSSLSPVDGVVQQTNGVVEPTNGVEEPTNGVQQPITAPLSDDILLISFD